MNSLSPYMKDVLGFIAPGATIIIASVLESSDGGTRITSSEWITALCTAIITATGVYAVPNRAAHRAGNVANPNGRI
jgi:hypothetical protein